jgi:hypothetical protein
MGTPKIRFGQSDQRPETKTPLEAGDANSVKVYRRHDGRYQDLVHNLPIKDPFHSPTYIGTISYIRSISWGGLNRAIDRHEGHDVGHASVLARRLEIRARIVGTSDN